ncbi:MAG: class I SAM-dependent DNA methyltransferase [Isosphaeraceae bacterium]
MTTPADWWRTFFSGVTVESWLKVVIPEQTRQEASFIRESLGVAPPARLLDVPCGGGRHCHALADDGYEMTGVDISAESLDAANVPTGERSRTIAWEHREMRDLPWPEAFDGAYCFGNSFGYLDEDGNAAFLVAVAAALKPGARFILDTGYIAESLLPVLQERAWYPIGDIMMLAHRRYDPVEGRLYVEYAFVRDGTIERRSMSARIHTCREVFRLLERAGFADLKAYGSLAGEPFRLGSNRLLMVATRS